MNSFFSNWNKSELPFAERLRVAMRNNWIKISTGKTCCGNHGEPGC